MARKTRKTASDIVTKTDDAAFPVSVAGVMIPGDAAVELGLVGETETITEEVAPIETVSDAEIESVVEEIEASAGTGSDDEPLEPSEAQRSFDEIVGSQDPEDVLQMARDVGHEIDIRSERADAQGRPTKNFDAARKKMISSDVAACLLASGVAYPSFIQREVHTGEAFNVYALKDKIPDIARALMGKGLKNAVNVAVIRSLFNLERAGKPLDFVSMKCATSKQMTVEAEGVRRHLVRHTVAPSTASTQAGSTLHGLLALNILETATAGKNAVYRFTDTPITRKLREVIVGASLEEAEA